MQPTAAGEKSKQRKERRPRTIQACNFCRTKKYKCDGSLPCSNCRRLQRSCVFNTGQDVQSGNGNISISYVKELERRLEAAEAALRKSVEANEETFAKPKQPEVVERFDNEPVGNGTDSTNFGSPSGSAVNLENCVLSELMDINTETKRFEFHGNSSIIGVLDRLVTLRTSIIAESQDSNLAITARPISAVTEFQNDAFASKADRPLILSIGFDDDYYSMYAPLFIDAYFNGLHYVHPLLDQDFFFMRCQWLWLGDTMKLRSSFMLLYYSILAIGASTRVWTEGPINGLERLEWIRLLLTKADQAISETEYQTDFEGAQALFILSQVCLQQLSYNAAYTYLGMAIRISQSSAVNRQMRQEESRVPVDSPTFVIARLWWTLYSHEIELSFILGRPDSLGHDSYINRLLPPVSDSGMGMIPAMYGLSQCLREISITIYHEKHSLITRLQKAFEIEQHLDEWYAQVPSYIHPVVPQESNGTSPSGDKYWTTIQVTMLRIRYLHAIVALYYPFSILRDTKELSQSTQYTIAIATAKCKDTAKRMTSEIFYAYKSHVFQRTWVYCSVYLVRGLAVIMDSMAQTPLANRYLSNDRDYIIQALHVLDVLDGCTTTHKIANFVRELLALLSAPIDVAPLQPIQRFKGFIFPPPRGGNFSNFGHYAPLKQPTFNHHAPTFNAFAPLDPSGFVMPDYTLPDGLDFGKPGP